MIILVVQLLLTLFLFIFIYKKNQILFDMSGGVVFSPLIFILINYLLVFMLRPFVLMYLNSNSLDYEIIRKDVVIEVINLGILSLLIFLMPYLILNSKPLVVSQCLNKDMSEPRLLLCNIFLILVVLLLISKFGSALNNTSERIKDPEKFKGFFVFIIIQRVYLVSCMLLFYQNITEKIKYKKICFVLLFLAPFVTLISAGRASFFYFVISYFIIYIFFNKINISFIKKIFVFFALIVFYLLNYFLSSVRIVLHGSDWKITDIIDVFNFSKNNIDFQQILVMSSWDYSVFDVCMRIVTHSKDKFVWGLTNVNYFLSYVPRIIWNEKPYDQGYMLFITNNFYKDVFDSTGSTFAGTIVGEGYINFGIPGVILYTFIFSFFYLKLYLNAIKSNSSFSILSYALLFPFMQQVFRGGLDVIVNLTIFIIIPLFLVSKFMELKYSYEKYGNRCHQH